ADFAINNGVVVSSVSYGLESSNLVLTLSTPLNVASNYTISVSNITDLSLNTLVSTQLAIGLTIEVPFDIGTTIRGFQDDFSGGSRNTDWVPVPSANDIYTQTGGVLRVVASAAAPGDPNHLLYEPATSYDGAAQEVLVRIKPNS